MILRIYLDGSYSEVDPYFEKYTLIYTASSDDYLELDLDIVGDLEYLKRNYPYIYKEYKELTGLK